VEALKKIAEDHGKTLPQFALAWVLSNKAITSIVCGATSVKQLEDNIQATGISISKEEMEACDEIWHQLRPPRLFYGR
jgi:aryl-alcohol dehydrogenase-like predicted oxidoreductase